MKTVGDRIRELRRSKGMTQEELGNIIGVTKASIQKYEKGTIQTVKPDVIENVNETSMKMIIGHKLEGVTKTVYTHKTAEDLNEAMKRFDEYIDKILVS